VKGSPFAKASSFAKATEDRSGDKKRLKGKWKNKERYMRPVSELKQDLDVSRSLGDIIDVLKTAALIQFRSFQFKEKPQEEFIKEAESCFEILAQRDIKHPYFFDRGAMPGQIVAVTSEEGFLGELNTLLINASLDQRRAKGDELIVLGERGGRYLEDMNQGFAYFPGITNEISYREVERLRDYLLKGYKKKFARIVVVYPEFVSLTLQKVAVRQILPYQFSNEPKKEAKGSMVIEELLIEPTVNLVVGSLVEAWFGFKLLDIFWSSKQSEFAARIMHLEGSTQELAHLKQRLSFEYFRQVHNLRDKVIREISASKVMLGKRAQAETLLAKVEEN
jgi:ATP synthase F1 gamma subunit